MWQNLKYIVDISVFAQDTIDIMGAAFFLNITSTCLLTRTKLASHKNFDKDDIGMLFLTLYLKIDVINVTYQ